MGLGEGDLHKNLCVSWFLVGKLLHCNNPTLSAAVARVQWHKELLRLGASLAAVDGQVFVRALTCPLHPTVRCWNRRPSR